MAETDVDRAQIAEDHRNSSSLSIIGFGLLFFKVLYMICILWDQVIV